VAVRGGLARRIGALRNHLKHLAVIGAGEAGQALVKDLSTKKNHDLWPSVILDDSQHKQGLRIHGVPVEGPISDLEKQIQRRGIDEVILACHQLPAGKIAQIHEVCQRLKVPFRRVPRFEDILEGKVSPFALLDIDVRDLLPRSDISLKTEPLVDFYRGKRVMITGSGGSIGSELVRQVCGCEPSQIVMFERTEFALYEIEREIRSLQFRGRVIPVIGDILDSARVDRVMRTYRPQILFHAAAYKHVPLMEENASEAFKNNAMGTENLVGLSMKHGVEKFILISTDKAVNPFNVMGYTKRVAELLLEERFGCSRTKFMAVRFGNVLNSAGSVVPLFREQIARGGPVTVTHPEVTRYFMTIPEAVQLVMESGRIGNGGEIFVLDMGDR